MDASICSVPAVCDANFPAKRANCILALGHSGTIELLCDTAQQLLSIHSALELRKDKKRQKSNLLTLVMSFLRKIPAIHKILTIFL